VKSRSRATPFVSPDCPATPESRLLLLPLHPHCGQCRRNTRTTRDWRTLEASLRNHSPQAPTTNTIEIICRTILRQGEKQEPVDKNTSSKTPKNKAFFLHALNTRRLRTNLHGDIDSNDMRN
jgi:hypothetical protein